MAYVCPINGKRYTRVRRADRTTLQEQIWIYCWHCRRTLLGFEARDARHEEVR